MKEEIEIMLRRAKVFERDAKIDFENKDYDIALLHIEQAIQLLLKAKLLDLTGYYEKTHKITKLMEDLCKVYENEDLESLLDNEYFILKRIEQAYISGRYLVESFNEKDVNEGFRILNKIKKLLWNF